MGKGTKPGKRDKGMSNAARSASAHNNTGTPDNTGTLDNTGVNPAHSEEGQMAVSDQDTSVQPEKHPLRVRIANKIIPAGYVVVDRAVYEEYCNQALYTEEYRKSAEESIEKISKLQNELRKRAEMLDDKDQEIKQLKSDLRNKVREYEDQHSSLLEALDIYFVEGKTWHEAIVDEYNTLKSNFNATSAAAFEKEKEERSLKQILDSPTQDERDLIYGFLRKRLQSTFAISDKVNPIDYLVTKVRDLQDKCRAKDNCIKEAQEKCQNCSGLPNFINNLNAGDDKCQAALNNWLLDRLNALLSDDRSIAGETLDATLNAVAAEINAPRSGEEAAELARRDCLAAVSDALGARIDSVEQLKGAVDAYVNGVLASKVTDRLTLKADSIEDLVEQLNEQVDYATRVRKTLAESECDTIADYAAAVKKKVIGVLAENIAKRLKSTGDEEIAQLGETTRGAESLAIKVAGAATKRLREKNQLQQALDEVEKKADASAAKLGADVEGKTVVQKVCTVIDTLDNELTLTKDSLSEKVGELDSIHTTLEGKLDIASDILGKELVGADDASRFDSLNREMAERVESDGKIIQEATKKAGTLEAGLIAEQSAHKATFEAYIAILRDALKAVGECTKASCQPGTEGNSLLADAVVNKVLSNPLGGYYDFFTDLEKVLAAVAHGDVEGARKAIADLVKEYQGSSKATWMDILVRLYLYSKVPFISGQFMAKSLSPAQLARAVEALSQLLAAGGLTIICPELFRTRVSEGDFDIETIRNIDSYIDDIAAHVPSDDTVIDMLCFGLSDKDGVIKKPIVSLFN